MPAVSDPAIDLQRRTTVTVRAPGRLHLGFLDPSGSLGRRFGSLGLVVDELATEVTIGPAATDEFVGDSAIALVELERARLHVERLRELTGRRDHLRLTLGEVLPPHAGLGSGTQLALAVGRAFARWQRIDVPTTTIAGWLGRGLRSGVGIAGFDHGGLLLDGGPSRAGVPAALLSRVELPPDWRIVLVQDPRVRGLSGADEKRAIAALPPLPRAAAADVCHQVLMRVLPGAADAEFEPFAAGLGRIQQVLGEHFAPAQGGRAFTSDAVERVVRGMAESPVVQGRVAIGQSSWGPTGFAIFASEAEARAALDAVRADHLVGPALDIRIVAGRNRGATVHDRRDD